MPVYFVGDTPQGTRLYREFRKVEADNPFEEAVALMMAGDALDPDYTHALAERLVRERVVLRGSGRDRGPGRGRRLDTPLAS